MKIICIIPSRIHSTRLPKKPLLPIQGKAMVQWTYENAAQCTFLSDIVVATDSEEIANLIKSIGGKAEITSSDFQTGTERIAAVAERYPDADVVINLQGDEPFVKAKMIEQLVSPYLNGETPEMTTLARPLAIEKYHLPSSVKVITDLNHNAIYFSRSPIPYFRSLNLHDNLPVYHHLGLYAFRKDFLQIYKTLAQTPLEKAESLEQLRVLEHGYKIRVCFTEENSLEINTPEEYEAAQVFDYLD